MYRHIPSKPRRIQVPIDSPRVLTPIDSNAWEAEEAELEVSTDICKVCNTQHERPVAFHELVLDDSSSSSGIENPNEAHQLLIFEEDSDLGSMPELKDEVNLDTLEIPL